MSLYPNTENSKNYKHKANKTIIFLKKDHSHSDKEIPRRRVEE